MFRRPMTGALPALEADQKVLTMEILKDVQKVAVPVALIVGVLLFAGVVGSGPNTPEFLRK